jgi:hypothetical protein
MSNDNPMNDENLIAVKCKVCYKKIPIDTHYVYTVCDCYDYTKYVYDYSEVAFTDSQGVDHFHGEYTGLPHIAVDGGKDYVRYMGDPDQFDYIFDKDDK